MIDFLEDCVLQFQDIDDDDMSFLKFLQTRFRVISSSLRDCVSIFCTHVSRSVLKCNFERMGCCLMSLIDSLQSLLFQNWVASEELKRVFSSNQYVCGSLFTKHEKLLKTRNDCIVVLKSLQQSLDLLGLPQTTNKGTIVDFCFQNASLFFCTVSSSFKLHSKSLEPLKALVIDEAAQLKECESVMPMHLADIKHAILIGDECQLPAMVESKVSDGAGFGRSLFERLSSLGHPKHLLNVQYRMHPSISLFPNSKFYSGLISDGPNVKAKAYEKTFLPGPIS